MSKLDDIILPAKMYNDYIYAITLGQFAPMCVPSLSAVIRSDKIELAMTDDEFLRLTTNLLKDDIGLLDETDMSPNDLRAKDDYRVKVI